MEIKELQKELKKCQEKIEKIRNDVDIKRKKYDEEVRKAVNNNDKNDKVQYLRGRSDSYQDVFYRMVGKAEESKKFHSTP